LGFVAFTAYDTSAKSVWQTPNILLDYCAMGTYSPQASKINALFAKDYPSFYFTSTNRYLSLPINTLFGPEQRHFL
jgi:hypothetical protein